jgi:predicted signal transduction protein with EAL and GGDEF domain
MDVQFQGEVLSGITISCGVAIFPNHGWTCRELTEAADLALYRAKREGRDRVVLAPWARHKPDQSLRNLSSGTMLSKSGNVVAG